MQFQTGKHVGEVDLVLNKKSNKSEAILYEVSESNKEIEAEIQKILDLSEYKKDE